MIAPEYWAAYLATGGVVGFLAGLLGVGGGLIVVPVLTFLFSAQHFPQIHIAHYALGTSLASIIFTSLSSLYAHHHHQAVDWQVVRRLSPGIVCGTLAGAVLAAFMTTNALKIFFVLFVYTVATRMLLDIKTKAARELPHLGGMFIAGNVIGGVSSLVGIGGGTLSVPFLTWCNVALHKAVGTAAALGLPIALAGAFGYVIAGLQTDSPPAYSLGFVYLPAVLGLVVTSIPFAPLGAKTAHSLPVGQLRKIFALILYLIGTRMLFTVV